MVAAPGSYTNAQVIYPGNPKPQIPVPPEWKIDGVSLDDPSWYSKVTQINYALYERDIFYNVTTEDVSLRVTSDIGSKIVAIQDMNQPENIEGIFGNTITRIDLYFYDLSLPNDRNLLSIKYDVQRNYEDSSNLRFTYTITKDDNIFINKGQIIVVNVIGYDKNGRIRAVFLTKNYDLKYSSTKTPLEDRGLTYSVFEQINYKYLNVVKEGDYSNNKRLNSNIEISSKINYLNPYYINFIVDKPENLFMNYYLMFYYLFYLKMGDNMNIQIKNLCKHLLPNENYFNITFPKIFNELNSYIKDYILISEYFKKSSEAQEFKNSLPFYNEIKLNFQETSYFAYAIENLNLENEFLTLLQQSVSLFEKDPNGFKESFYSFTPPENKVVIAKGSDNKEDINIVDINIKYDSLGQHIVNYINDKVRIEGAPGELDYVILTNNNYRLEKNKRSNSYFYSIIPVVFNNLINFKDKILDKEIVAFQIQKKRNGQIISNNFFLNSINTDLFDLVDSQVKYNVLYDYDVYGFIYNDIVYRGKTYKFFSRVKLNQASVTAGASYSYPMAPTFNVFLERNKKNNVIFLIDKLIGKMEEYFIPIDGDPVMDSKKIFYNGSYNNNIEIYRLDTKPTSYKDFSKGKVYSLKATTFIDEIEPNKDYYYMMRTINYDFLASNPSYVLKVRLVSSENINYLESYPYAHYKMYDVPKDTLDPWVLLNSREKENKNIKKTFKKYLHIKPSDIQTLIKNLDPNILKYFGDSVDNSYDSEIFKESEDKPEIDSTPIAKQILGKKYKLRVKSKVTSKIIDIYFQYALNNKFEPIIETVPTEDTPPTPKPPRSSVPQIDIYVGTTNPDEPPESPTYPAKDNKVYHFIDDANWMANFGDGYSGFYSSPNNSDDSDNALPVWMYNNDSPANAWINFNNNSSDSKKDPWVADISGDWKYYFSRRETTVSAKNYDISPTKTYWSNI